MKCDSCGGNAKIITGDLSLSRFDIGPYIVKGVKYYECETCGERFFPHEALLKIEMVEQQLLEQKIGQLPIDDFIFSNDVCSILKISRQAFNKNPKIRKGFIYSVKKGSYRLYHKRSVELFNETGDGRFPLPHNSEGRKREIEKVIVVQFDKDLYGGSREERSNMVVNNSQPSTLRPTAIDYNCN